MVASALGSGIQGTECFMIQQRRIRRLSSSTRLLLRQEPDSPRGMHSKTLKHPPTVPFRPRPPLLGPNGLLLPASSRYSPQSCPYPMLSCVAPHRAERPFIYTETSGKSCCAPRPLKGRRVLSCRGRRVSCILSHQHTLKKSNFLLQLRDLRI